MLNDITSLVNGIKSVSYRIKCVISKICDLWPCLYGAVPTWHGSRVKLPYSGDTHYKFITGLYTLIFVKWVRRQYNLGLGHKTSISLSQNMWFMAMLIRLRKQLNLVFYTGGGNSAGASSRKVLHRDPWPNKKTCSATVWGRTNLDTSIIDVCIVHFCCKYLCTRLRKYD